jgi:hypothetical protein
MRLPPIFTNAIERSNKNKRRNKMANKKSPNKKTTKSTPKKATAKKSTAKKSTPKKATAKKLVSKKTVAKKQIICRPDSNLPPTPEHINAITNIILGVIGELDDYTANLRALDRQRHNGVGLKRLGFIEAAFRLSTKFPQYFPHWLTTEKFQKDLDLFNAIRSLVEVSRSLEEKAWNINVESSDMIYTDGLEYYSQVQDAAHRMVDSAESLYSELHGFFRRGPMESDQPPRKKLNVMSTPS